eukprot:8918580-Pyramimonas_sp.AAC.1
MNPFTDQDARWRVDFVGDVETVKHRMSGMISTLECRAWASRAMRVAQLIGADRSMSARQRREMSMLFASGAVGYEQSFLFGGIVLTRKSLR